MHKEAEFLTQKIDWYLLFPKKPLTTSVLREESKILRWLAEAGTVERPHQDVNRHEESDKETARSLTL